MIIKEDLDSPARALRDVADDLATLASAIDAGSTVAAAVALTSSQNSTTNGSDPGTTQTLANALKVSYNALQVDVAALRTKLNELIAAVTAVDGASVVLKTTKG